MKHKININIYYFINKYILLLLKLNLKKDLRKDLNKISKLNSFVDNEGESL